jgi:hypothetical protein
MIGSTLESFSHARSVKSIVQCSDTDIGIYTDNAKVLVALRKY